MRLRTLCLAALVTLAAIHFVPQAHACKDSMRFTQDKQQHFMLSFAAGAAARTVTADPYKAFALGMVPGVAKEVYDMQHPDRHCASFNDLAWDAIGVGLGVYGTNWALGPGVVVFHWEF